MSEIGFDEEVERFIADHIHSVEQLEVLLLLERTSAREWTAESVCAELRTSVASAALRLDDLTARGLLTRRDGPPPSYMYDPVSPELRGLVRALGATYAERRLAVINMIFSKPTEKFEAMRAFANAFRIRRGVG